MGLWDLARVEASMSFPLISRKSRYKASSGRLVSQFVKRLEKGLVIDRTVSQPGSKSVKTLSSPKSLQPLTKE